MMKQEDHLEKAEELRKDIYRNMSTSEKLRATERLIGSAKALKAAYYHKIHTELSEEDTLHEWALNHVQENVDMNKARSYINKRVMWLSLNRYNIIL